jgi:GxxExxY protein
MSNQILEADAKHIIGIAIEVHKQLGPGFQEKIYQRALYLELKNRGMKFEREKKIEIRWKQVMLGYQVVDFVINKNLLIELKAVPGIIDAHIAQMVSYLKASNLNLGLILNFGKPTLEIKRVANKL